MKKNIFRFFLCLSAAMIFVACEDTMDDKAVIDANHQQTVTATPTISPIDAANVTFYSAAINLPIEDSVGVVEAGVEVSVSEDFSNSWYVSVSEVTKNAVVNITGLEELTTYYVRPYYYTVNGATVLGEATSFTTLETPTFPIDGVYTTTEYTLGDAGWTIESDPYEIEITFVEGSETEVAITNLWGAGTTISGTYDAEAQTITVASPAAISDNLFGYGPGAVYGLNDEISAYVESIVFSFVPKGGKMVSSPFQVRVSAGAFGIFIVEMQHNF